MKKINNFRPFDWVAFSKDKSFACTGIKYSEKKEMIVADIVIISDNTDYGDETVTNVFEKFKVSVPGTNESDLTKFVSFINHECVIGNVQKVSVYGDYSNELRVTGSLQLIKKGE